MRTRHKIPTIFNLSMVDVLCCALGCVILLWLVNFREAKRRTLAAGETAVKLDAANQELAALRSRLTDAHQQLAALQGERDAAVMRAEMTARDRDKVRGQLSDVEDRLSKKTVDAQALTRSLALTEKEREALQALLRDKEALARAAAKDAEGLNLRLRDADTQMAKLRSLADRLPGLERDLAALRDKSTNGASRLLTLERELLERTKELATARASIDDLRNDKKTLAIEVAKVRADADNRFAGISLTGRRVIFLIDMSGSMEFIDEQTPDPSKWQGVCDTFAKIARSLPDLEKFQVIGFTKEATFVLGGEGRWLDFDGRTSVEQARRALTAVKPKGATNMYAAFEAAFRYRALGLDTIYVLSDGLPNIGAGLKPEQAAAKMKDTEKAEILGAYVRKTLKSTWNRAGIDKSRVRINAVGFFYESPDVGAFLWALARENDGSFVGMSRP